MTTVSGRVLDMLRRFVRFGDMVTKAAVVDAKELRREFFKEVRDFNEQPNAGSYPLFFISREDQLAEGLPEDVIIKIVKLATEMGAEDGLRVVRLPSGNFIHFGHRLREVANQICAKLGLGWANINDNGLILEDFHILSLQTANREVMVASVKEAQAILRAMESSNQ
ncbi:hypothetical protein ACYPKM_03400 [Pseudomonas aeruginosa]